MSCVEKRHMSHRAGSMLHHRFPNGFTDLFMDETDREVSTLTDRAFRSLCVGDDAVYNDDFLCGFSPFSCHKPLAGEPLKKNHNKESKKHGQSKNEKTHGQPWKHHQQKNISHMSSFLKALSATEESCKGMLIKNGSLTVSNGESWDKTALRSIQRELSEFSSDYHTSLTDQHYTNPLQHQPGDASSSKTGRDVGLPTGKSKRIKNGKSTVKLRKLNIKNFFLHSEFSPFQTWTDFNQFPFGQEDTVTPVLPIDSIPKMYELPLYKELTEACRKETLHAEEPLSALSSHCSSRQKEEAEPCLPTAPKPTIPPPQPPKVLPKPSAVPAEKRCSSDGGDGTAAPWRRNRARAKSAIPVNQPGITPQDKNSKTVDESLLLVKKEATSVEVKAVQEVSSVASTPFSICQLMTPLIPSRQPTETSEILTAVFSPTSAFDLQLRPHSEAKLTPEPPVRRDSYKSLASSILFNLKDNRKRVKSRYTPPKFKTSELTEGDTGTPQSENLSHPRAGSEGNASGFSTPAMMKDGLTVCSAILESPTVDLTNNKADKPLSDDYLLSNLLQTKTEVGGNLNFGEENPVPPFIPSKKNKSPMAKKQNYPSLNLYKKASPADGDMKYLPVPQITPAHAAAPAEADKVSPLMLNKELSPKALPANTGLSPNTSNVIKDRSPIISPHTRENEGLPSVGKRPLNVPEKTKRSAKDTEDFEVLQTSKEKEAGGQIISTVDVIRAAREAINAAKNKALSAALSAAHSDSVNKPTADREEPQQKETDEKAAKEMFGSKKESSAAENNVSSQNRDEVNNETQAGKNINIKKEPPPVPARNFAKSDIKLALDKQQTRNDELEDDKLDLPPKENDPVQKQGKLKYIFSARQNNYIKHQRFAVTEDELVEESEEGNPNVNTKMESDDETRPRREMKDSEHIVNDLHALKELERAKLGNRVLENARNKLGILSIDEETKAKNDLISRELRNIKRGMLSMRGNTSAKREIFAKKEQSKPEGFTKLDGNVIVNKAVINDNYDKAKMALEEIISEREKRKNKLTDTDKKPQLDEKVCNESYETEAEQCKNSRKEAKTDGKDKQHDSTNALKEKELKERLGDLRDHNHLRQILSLTEPRLSESHRSGGRVTQPGFNKTSSEVNTLPKTTANTDANFIQIARQVSEESGVYLMNETAGKKVDVPPIPPRIKKGGHMRRGSVTSEKDVADENLEVRLNVMGKDLATQEVDGEDAEARQNETSSDKDRWDLGVNLISSEFRASEDTPNNLQLNMSPTRSAVFNKNNTAKTQETCRIKRKAPLKPDHLITADGTVTTNLGTDGEPNKIRQAVQDENVDAQALGEIPRNIISPLLLVNGVSVAQSPPDQASLSSKSSYFSVESALHNSENIIEEVEKFEEAVRNVSRNTRGDSDRADVEYYSLSDHESEPEALKQPVQSPQQELEICKDGKERESATTDENNSTTLSPVDTFSPTLGIPALFKVKDNTFINKFRKTIQPWSPRGSLSGSERGSERGQDELHHVQECQELTLTNEISAATSGSTSTLEQILQSKEISSPPLLVSPSNLHIENLQKPQAAGFLTVPQEEDRFSGLSPSSEGVESLTASTADTSEETVLNAGEPTENDMTNAFSESLGSTYSGNDSQTALPKPPPVLPKSEKAVLKAIKLANRRMKKEEAQKSSHKSSQSSSKHRAERHKADKSEHRSTAGNKNGRSSEKKHRGKAEDDHGGSHHSKNSSSQSEQLLNKNENHHPHNKTEFQQETQRQDHKSPESNNQRREALPGIAAEREGRSSSRRSRDKTEQRHYSSDRVISNVPVYKAHVSEKQVQDRPLHRTQSIDRYLGDKAEHGLSADASVNEKLDPRTQRIEQSIMDEFQQRGRARDKAIRDNPLRRSHSIDVNTAEVPHPSSLSRQLSHSSQLSRQSSIEHALVTQSFPMTQRKLLQDPDSGQYFFVDVPVQVKTKTFFDPEMGSYVQLPIQPPDGAVPKASPMEVLNPPLVVYHGFVPVCLSPMAPKATVQAPHVEPEDFEQRNIERSKQIYCTDAHPYLEPIYGQNEYMLGEFIGTEELDCPS